MQNTKTFTLGNKKLHLVFLTTVGSTLHQLNLSNSDLDLKGVFVWDKTATSGLETMPDSLDFKRTLKDEWADLMSQLNDEFNLNLSPDDDVELFEARKFFLTALKNDFNMLDMLFSSLTPVFLADVFQETLEKKEDFLDMKSAEVRFSGMAKSALHEAKKLSKKEEKTPKMQNDLKKSLAKSLQFVFSLNNLFLNQVHSPVLPDDERKFVLNVKKGNVSLEDVAKKQVELFEELEKTKLNKNLLLKTSNRDSLNTVLQNLNLSVN
jgi:predicted nucleotidyltransferase